MKATNTQPNYRIYDCTGGGATEDIYAASLSEALEMGREWIEAGDWDSIDDGVYRTIALECEVGEIVYRPVAPDISGACGRYDFWEPVWGSGALEWRVDVSDLILGEGEDYDTVSDLLERETGGSWSYDDEADVMIWTPPEGHEQEIDEDATTDAERHDCSGEFSDELPECDAAADEGGEADIEKDSDGHDWCSPHSLVGGLKENPGFWSCSGTITKSKQVCACCGKYKTETDKGSQCHESEARVIIEIEDRDEASTDWLKRIHSANGYLPEWLAEYLGDEELTFAHMRSQVSELRDEAQGISSEIYQEIEDADIEGIDRDEAMEWLNELRERLAEEVEA